VFHLHYFSLSTVQAHDKEHTIATFQTGTGISNLRKHLVKNHLQAWIKACSDNGITMSDASLEGIKGLHGDEIEGEEHPLFTKEAFSEALIEFVVGDDVVSKNGHMDYILFSFRLAPEDCGVSKTLQNFLYA